MISQSEEISLYIFLIISILVAVFFFLSYFIQLIKFFDALSIFNQYKFYCSYFLSILIFKFRDKTNFKLFISSNLLLNDINFFMIISPISSLIFCPILWRLERTFNQNIIICFFLFLMGFSQFLLIFHSKLFLIVSEIFNGILSSFCQIFFEYIFILNHYRDNNYINSVYIYCQITLLIEFCSLIASDALQKVVFDRISNQYQVKSLLALLSIIPLYFLMKKDKKKEEFQFSKLKYLLFNQNIFLILLFGCFHDVYTNFFVYRIPEMINFSIYFGLSNVLSYMIFLWSYLVLYFNGINLAIKISKNRSRLSIVIVSTFVIEMLLFVLNKIYGGSFLPFFFILMSIALFDGILRPSCLIVTVQNVQLDVLFVIMTLEKTLSQIISYIISVLTEKNTIKINTYYSILFFIVMNTCAICLKLIAI